MERAESLLFIAPTPDLKYGGEASHFELIKGAKKRGYKIHVIVPGPGEFARELRKAGISSTVLRYSYWNLLHAFSNDISNFATVGSIVQIIKKKHIDCVITNTLHVPWGALAAAATGVPHVWIARETPEKQFSYIRDKYDFISAYSNVLIANSKELAVYMRNKLGLTQTQYFFSYVNTESISLDSQIEEPRIVNVGNIQQMKNQKLLIEAAAILQKRNKLKYPVLLLGGYSKIDPYYSKLKELIVKNDLKGMIRFEGFKKNPYKLIGPNDIFVQTSLLESIGRATTEAMKLGLICLGADIPGTREAFSLGGGQLFDGKDANSLANILEKVMDDLPRAKSRAKQAQLSALKNMSEKASNGPFFKVLEGVFGKPNPRQELSHMYADFTSLEGIIKNYEHKITEYRALVNKLESHLNNIINSRSWKAVLMLRKYLRRDKKRIEQ